MKQRDRDLRHGEASVADAATASLIAWVSIGVVVAVVLTIVLVKTLGSSRPTSSARVRPALAAQVYNERHPGARKSVFNTIGVNSRRSRSCRTRSSAMQQGPPAFTEVNDVACPAPSTTARSSARTAPRRAGASSSRSRGSARSPTRRSTRCGRRRPTTPPNTPTFTFYDASYTSKYLAFKGYEVEDRNGRPPDDDAARRRRTLVESLQPRPSPSRSWTSTTRRSSSTRRSTRSPSAATRPRRRSPRR